MEMVGHQAICQNMYELPFSWILKSNFNRDARRMVSEIACGGGVIEFIQIYHKAQIVAGCLKDESLFHPAVIDVIYMFVHIPHYTLLKFDFNRGDFDTEATYE